MAVSTAVTTLMVSDSDKNVFTKLCDITSYPDLGSAPNKLDTTDLSATKMMTNILGLQEAPDLEFEANYDKEAYEKINKLTGVKKFKLEFGPAGAQGAFTWNGQVIAYVNGAGVDEVRKMTISISAETEIKAAE